MVITTNGVTTMAVDAHPTFLTRKQLAERWGTTEGSLATRASTRKLHLPFVKLGRSVRYRIEDVLRFEDEQTVRPAEPISA
jgi:hypothetical protein